MKTDTLFPLPPPQETRLEKIKRENGITTEMLYSLDEPPEWGARMQGSLTSFGETEADAVFALCRQMKIPCVL